MKKKVRIKFSNPYAKQLVVERKGCYVFTDRKKEARKMGSRRWKDEFNKEY